MGIDACNPPEGYVVDSSDCDDGDAQIHPGASETCDGIDNDCNGVADDGFPDTDGDGIGDYYDDEDDDTLINGDEWKYDPSTGLPVGWCDPQGADSDGDSVLDGYEVDGNPLNKDQTSDPNRADTDGDRLTDDIDPRTWIRDHLPFSRVSGNGAGPLGAVPAFPALVNKGVPFIVEGFVEYNVTAYTGPGTGEWTRIEAPMVVQIWVEQDGVLIPLSDPVVTGDYGNFRVSGTIGDNVRAGETNLVITTTIHQGSVDYLPVLWDELVGNHLL